MFLILIGADFLTFVSGSWFALTCWCKCSRARLIMCMYECTLTLSLPRGGGAFRPPAPYVELSSSADERRLAPWTFLSKYFQKLSFFHTNFVQDVWVIFFFLRSLNTEKLSGKGGLSLSNMSGKGVVSCAPSRKFKKSTHTCTKVASCCFCNVWKCLLNSFSCQKWNWTRKVVRWVCERVVTQEGGACVRIKNTECVSLWWVPQRQKLPFGGFVSRSLHISDFGCLLWMTG